MASKFNFNLDAGVDNVVEISYIPNGVAFDLTGWAVVAQLRRTWASETVDCELSTALGTIAVASSNLTLTFSAAATPALSGVYVYDVVATFGTMKRRIVEGSILATPAVTR